MSFLKSLFGRREPAQARPEPGKTREYKGFMITSAAYQEGGQYQLAGVIEKEIDGEVKRYRFVRADRFPGADEAADFALVKGQQLIDEQGEAIFR